jgi:hypothetical protein
MWMISSWCAKSLCIYSEGAGDVLTNQARRTDLLEVSAYEQYTVVPAADCEEASPKAKLCS